MSDNTAHKYRKRPVEVWAMEFRTNNEQGDVNMNAICIWINQGKSDQAPHAWHNGTNIFIQTLEGTMAAQCGDWIIQGVFGEYYPCKPEVFKDTYDAV